MSTMALEMLRQRVERRLDLRLVAERRWADAEAGEEGAAEAVGGEDAVDVGAGDQAIRRPRAVHSPAEVKHRPRAIRAGRLAEMDLVAG